MPRAKKKRECLAHYWDCARAGGSSYRSGRCAPLPEEGREPAAGVGVRAIFARMSPAEVAAQDAEHAARFAALTPQQRCEVRDRESATNDDRLTHMRAVRSEVARFLSAG